MEWPDEHNVWCETGAIRPDEPRRPHNYRHRFTPEESARGARKGGKAVPKDKRTYARDRALAYAAGKKGMAAVVARGTKHAFTPEERRRGGGHPKGKRFTRARSLKVWAARRLRAMDARALRDGKVAEGRTP